MSIDDLTVENIKEIKKISFGDTSQLNTHSFIGKFCIARCHSAGVHAGYVDYVDNDKVILSRSRRLWSWKGTSIALSGVAQGKLIDGRLDMIVPEIYLTGVIELIPCTEESRKSIYDK